MSRTLDDFCDRIMADDHPIRRLEPEGLAAEFTDYFRVPLRVPLDDLAVLLECAGVGDVSERRLDGGLRGIHYIQPDGTYAIHYLAGQWEGTSKLTVLHETFEIIHEQVWDRHHDCQPTRGVCPEAERFAAATLMPREVFAAYAQVGGLDVVALHNLFHCAYSAIALRMSEAMPGQPMLLALYERRGQNDPVPLAHAYEVGRPAGHGDEANGGHGDAPLPAAQRVAGRGAPQGQGAVRRFPGGTGGPQRQAGVRRGGRHRRGRQARPLEGTAVQDRVGRRTLGTPPGPGAAIGRRAAVAGPPQPRRRAPSGRWLSEGRALTGWAGCPMIVSNTT